MLEPKVSGTTKSSAELIWIWSSRVTSSLEICVNWSMLSRVPGLVASPSRVGNWSGSSSVGVVGPDGGMLKSWLRRGCLVSSWSRVELLIRVLRVRRHWAVLQVLF